MEIAALHSIKDHAFGDLDEPFEFDSLYYQDLTNDLNESEKSCEETIIKINLSLVMP